MRKIVVTAMLAALWMGYNEKHRPKEPEHITVAVLYNLSSVCSATVICSGSGFG